jgi:hypothetical protein
MTDKFSTGANPSLGLTGDLAEPENGRSVADQDQMGTHATTAGSASGDVASTLAELEHRLDALERQLNSIAPGAQALTTGAAPPQPAQASFPPAQVSPPSVSPPSFSPQARVIDESSSKPSPAPNQRPQSRLVDEATEKAEPPTPSPAELKSLPVELERLRNRLQHFALQLSEDFEQLLDNVKATQPSPTQTHSSPQSPTFGPPVTAGDAAPETSPTGQPGPFTDQVLFDGHVELGAGPFYDMSSLSEFEQLLAGLPDVQEACVRRFEASHAVIDIRLAAPMTLVGQLRDILEADFTTRQLADGRLLLTFDDV